jgi:hypothetical protein
MVATLFMAGQAFACGIHGTNGGRDAQAWINSNFSSSAGVNAPVADGGQSRRDDNGNAIAFNTNGGGDGDVEVGDDFAEEGERTGADGGNWGNENYWVNVTLPNGDVVTINATAEEWERSGGGGRIEHWLRDQAKQVIRDWFEDYEPSDQLGDTFIG